MKHLDLHAMVSVGSSAGFGVISQMDCQVRLLALCVGIQS